MRKSAVLLLGVLIATGGNLTALRAANGAANMAQQAAKNATKAPPAATASPYGNYAYTGGPGGPQGPGAAPKRQVAHMDPNEVKKKVQQFDGLAAALKPVEDKSGNEQRDWIMRRTDNRTILFAAEEQQLTDELAFVKPIATGEKAVKTVKAIDDLTAKRKKRAEVIGEQLRELRRASLAQARQAAGPRGMRGGRGQMQSQMPGGYPGTPGYAGPSPYGNTATKAPATQPAIDPNTQALLQAWTNAKPDDKRALLQAVSDDNLLELQTLDELAVQEKAMKTSAAIEALMMFRDQRVEKITQAWQDEDARLQRLGRGGPGMQQQPGQMQMPMRGGRRGR